MRVKLVEPGRRCAMRGIGDEHRPESRRYNDNGYTEG